MDYIATHYYDRLVRFFRRRGGSDEDAADLAHDMFTRLFSVDLAEVRKPESFLFTMALNLLRDRAKSAHSRHSAMSVSVEDTQLACPAPQAERVLDGQQQLRVLERALQELNPKCRAVFVLFHFDGVLQRDIASQLGISVSMVEKYIKQAVQHCRTRMTDLQGDPLQ